MRTVPLSKKDAAPDDVVARTLSHSFHALSVRAAKLLALGCITGVWGISLGAEPSATSSAFHISGTYAIGGEGSWDYADYDSAHRHLFVARIGGILVIDTQTMKPVGSIAASPGMRTHGVALASALGIGMTSDGSDETSTVFDLATLKTLRKVRLGHEPDNIVYDPGSHRAVAFDGDDRIAVVFDPVAGVVTGQVGLPGSAEGAAVDSKGSLYVNLIDKDEIAVIDTQRWTLKGHWKIGGGCEQPTPLAINHDATRLFVGCRSGFLAVVDARKQSVIATVPIGKGVDAVGYDPTSHLIFASCYDGTLTIVSENSSDHYSVLQSVVTAPGARTLALDPAGPRVFLPVADLGPALPKVGDMPSRPAVVPATFRILTVGR
jgi:DNA-binding beta-propeller fold protein YncE